MRRQTELKEDVYYFIHPEFQNATKNILVSKQSPSIHGQDRMVDKNYYSTYDIKYHKSRI